MSEMVERVARAIFDAWATDVGSADSWEDLKQAVMASSEEEAPTLHQMHRQAYAEARAAIEAMREPTGAMLKAGVNWDTKITVTETYPHDRGTWRAMIDAALASERKP